MIRYSHGRWGVTYLFQLRGSVFPKALVWAIPGAGLAAGLSFLKDASGYEMEVSSSSALTAVASFVSILGFMLVFRSNQAWSRYWEAADLLQQARGEWISAASSVFALCSVEPKLAARVLVFQNQIVRLTSLLYATSLRVFSDIDDIETLDLSGLNQEALGALDAEKMTEVKIELIMQWIQRSIMEQIREGVVSAPAPIATRVFNELSAGVVKVSSLRKIKEVPFPFHYAQMLGAMLLVYTFGAPAMSAYLLQTWWGAAATSFLNIFILWCVNYLSVDIEQPFGDRANDLPLHEEMAHMNRTLEMLMKGYAKRVPAYEGPAAAPKVLATVNLAMQLDAAAKIFRDTETHTSSEMAPGKIHEPSAAAAEVAATLSRRFRAETAVGSPPRSQRHRGSPRPLVPSTPVAGRKPGGGGGGVSEGPLRVEAAGNDHAVSCGTPGEEAEGVPPPPCPPSHLGDDVRVIGGSQSDEERYDDSDASHDPRLKSAPVICQTTPLQRTRRMTSTDNGGKDLVLRLPGEIWS
mmetsp:Transcript_68468/g.198585  ORF Transcript_68468/g.198585 Transcript_68468/m.198585 type:complete len:521 (+) Transcript_68468:91-1653(+)